MNSNYSLMEAGEDDLPEIYEFLCEQSMQPSDDLWERYCTLMSAADPIDSASQKEKSFIVVDKIGAIRGFVIVRKRCYPPYSRLLDVPVLAIEPGPNASEIARIAFESLVALASSDGSDALRFAHPTPAAWVERLARCSETPLTGTIVPLR